jgi:hypothetical protein
MNNLNKTTKFSVTSYDRTTTIEVDHCDVDMGEFLDIVKVLAIGMTFHEDTFKRGIIELGAQYEEEMREEDMYRPDPTLEKSVDDYFRNLSEKEIDEALAEHNADEDADWDVTLNDGLENDGWTEELEKQYWEEQCPEPFATPEELSRDGGFDGNPIKVEKKKKKDAKRK